MKLKFLPILFLPTLLFSQTTFNYDRSWGTYFGGITTAVTNIYEKNNSDIKVDAVTLFPELVSTTALPPPATYYNQFVVSSSNYFTLGVNDSKNNFSGNFSASGSVSLAEYSLYKNTYSNKSFPAYRDIDGNRYDIESELISYPSLSNGTWHNTNLTNDDSILSKYDSNGNLVWKTYVPENLDSDFFIETDNSGNIYIAGTTKWTNLGDSGTYEPQFTYVQSPIGEPLSNSYVVKLNAQGQKIWATYVPSKTIIDIDVFDNNVYIATGEDISNSASALATAGTFQQAKALNSIIKLNGSSGNRTLGTYYGLPNNGIHGTINNIKVTSTGVYILGTNTNSGSYYGEEGAYMPASSGLDLFVSKFNDTGNRNWSTYFGTTGPELIFGHHNLDVKDDKIIISGHTFGNQNISTAGAFQSIKPSNIGALDVFFSMFDTSGSLLFSSYYGGDVPNSSQGGYQVSDINCKFSPNSDAFYLYGSASSSTGYTTTNGHQQTLIYPSGINIDKGGSGYIAKFSSLNLSVSESNISDNLKMYDNPNNGSFTLSGDILTKEPHFVTLYDMSGKLVYSKKLEKSKSANFNLQGILSDGNYMLSVSNSQDKLIKSFKLIIKK